MKIVTKDVRSVFSDDIHVKATYCTNNEVWDDLAKMISWEMGFIAAWPHTNITTLKNERRRRKTIGG